jgi:hypothetical protein
MSEEYGKESRDPLARANELSEVAILWGLVLTAVLVVAALIRGMFG